MNSIRRRLLVWQLLALLLTALITGWATYAIAWRDFNRQRDDNLEQIAFSILRHGTTNADGSEASEPDTGDFVSQIWDDKDQLIYTSLDNGGPPKQAAGPHTFQWAKQEWHSFTLISSGLTIQVANPRAKRSRMFKALSLEVWVPMALMIALMTTGIWWGTRRAMQPLNVLEHELQQRQANSLSPIALRDAPRELSPVLHALNDLLDRVRLALDSQTHFIADAAHELRSPLTALKLQAQWVRDSQDEHSRQQGLNELTQGVDRAARMVEQLLGLAALDAVNISGLVHRVDMTALTQEVMRGLEVLADDKLLALDLDAPAPAWVLGDAASLRILLRNVIDNAIRYTPAQGEIHIRICTRDDLVEVVVCDSGEGIPAALRERVWDRFFRVHPERGQGSGLGLSLVKRVIDAHQASIRLDDASLGGLAVHMRWPAAPTTA